MANLLSTTVNGSLLALNNGVTNAYTTASNGRLFLGSNAQNDYSIYTHMEDFGGNYTKLTLDWHTGIKIGASQAYGGIRFYSDSITNSGVRLFSVGEGDANVRVTNNLYIGSSGGWITDLLAAKQNASTAITTGNIGSQSVSVARQLLSPNDATVVAADSAMPSAGHSFIHTLALGPGGNDGHILGMSWAGTTSIYGAQIFLDTDPNDIMAIRSRSNAGVWTSWKTIIHSGTIGSQSVSFATSAGALTSMNISQFTNNSGYITSGDTTTGIFTTFLGNGTSNIGSGYTRVIRNENGLGGNPNYAPILHIAASDTMWQIAGPHAGQTNLVWRSGYAGTWETPWWTILHTGNYTSFAPSLTGTGASGTWGISITGNANTATTAGSATTASTAGSAGSVDGLTINNSGAPINPNNVTQNQIGYNDSVALFGQSDGGLYSSAYSSSWIHQIYGDFRSGQIAIRGKNSGTWGDWRIVVDDRNIASYAVPYGNMTSSTGLNDNKLYLRTNGDNNHYIWNAADDWEEIVAYSGTGLRIKSSTGVTLATFTTSGNSMDITGNAATASSVAWGNVSSKPSYIMYYQGFELNANTMDSNSTGFTYANNAPFYGPIARFSTGGGYDLWIGGAYSGGGNGFYIRTRNGDAGTFNDWREIITSGNIGSQSVASAGNATTANGANGNFYIDDNYGNTVVGLYDSTRYQGVFAMGDAYKLPANGTTTGSLYGLAWSHPNAGGVAGNLNTHGLLVMENGTFLAAISGSIRSRDDMRAPIFYDSANTAYYGDFNGISSMYGVAIRGDQSSTDTSNQIFFWSTGNTTTSAIGFKANGGYFTNPTGYGDGYNTYLTMDSPGRGWVFREGRGGADFGAAYTSGWILNNGVWQANASMRAPIFYDSNDTAFYVDPNSSSRVRNLYVGDSGSNWVDTGGWGTQFHVSNGPHSIIRVYARDEAIQTVMYSHNGGQSKVGSGTNHDFAIVRNFSDRMTFYSGYTYANGYLQAADSLRAPIFYDSNDTSYYGDFAGFSRMSEIGVTNDYVYNYDSIDSSRAVAEFGNVGKYVAKRSAAADYPSFSFEHTFGNHSWGQIARFHIGGSGGVDRPSIQFSSAQSNDRWNIGFCTGTDNNFRISQNMGYRPDNSGTTDGWGTARLIMNTSGVVDVPQGYISNGNPWSTANSAFFPNGITTAGGTNWIYGTTTFIGNAPGNGAGHDFSSSGHQYSTGSITTPLFLVNNHSDNTRGYRIHNTSSASVSAMFVNSSNALVIAAGAVDQINLNKKVFVNGVALGVNVTPSGTAGRIDASNDIVAFSSSDERLKENITPIANALDKVKSLTGVEFDWKPEHKEAHGHEGHDTGIIAQQVLSVMPTAVRTNDTGYLAVRYEKLIGLLIEGMKEQQTQIDELKAKLDGLTK